jgi:hypothetical protein
MELVHFTSRRNLKKILKSGSLEPRSPFYCEEDSVYFPDQELSTNKYITSIPKNRLGDWQKHPEIWDCLEKHTKGEIRISFPVKDLDGVLVREHHYLTGEYANERYNLTFPGLGQMPASQSQIAECMRLYVESSTPVSDAQIDIFRVPEIWVPYKIPVGELTIEEVKPTRPSNLRRVVQEMFTSIF